MTADQRRQIAFLVNIHKNQVEWAVQSGHKGLGVTDLHFHLGRQTGDGDILPGVPGHGRVSFQSDYLA